MASGKAMVNGPIAPVGIIGTNPAGIGTIPAEGMKQRIIGCDLDTLEVTLTGAPGPCALAKSRVVATRLAGSKISFFGNYE